MTDNDQAELTDDEEENEQAAANAKIEGDDRDLLAGFGRRSDERADRAGETEYRRGDKRPLDHGVKVRGKVKRGTDTRDQDELLIEGRGEDAAEAAADFEEALTEAEERDWADRLRAMQPGDEGGEGGD